MPLRVPTLEYFGACPICHEAGEYLNVHKSHFFLCDDHKVAWHVGWNLFLSWKFESPEDWQRNQEKLQAEFREVEPSIWAWQPAPRLSKLYQWWMRDWLRIVWYRCPPKLLQKALSNWQYKRHIRRFHREGGSIEDFPF